MSDTQLLTKREFVSLMEQKRGPYFTIGWLTSAWQFQCAPDEEQNIIQKEAKILVTMSDYKSDA